jgi:hypothetical protein
MSSICRSATLVLILYTSAGCAAATAASSGPAIETDRTVYAVNDSAGLANLTIRMTYRNNTGKDVYLPTCRGPQPPRLQKQVGDSWVVAFAPNVLACEGAPITVRAGDIYNYTFRILAGMPGSNYAPRFAVSEIPGTYRVLWEIFSGTRGDPSRPGTTIDPLPLDQQISNTFRLVR